MRPKLAVPAMPDTSFPLLRVLVITLAIGAHALTAFRLQPLVTALVSLGLALYAIIIPQRFVIPLYPRPETVLEIALADAQPVRLCFGDAVCIRASALTPEGDPGAYRLTLYWQAQPGPRPDLYARLRMRGSDGFVLLESEFWPIPSFSTVAWDPAQIYVTRHPLQVPPGTPAGAYFLELSLTVGQGGDPLPARGAGDAVLDEWARLVELSLPEAIPLLVQYEVPRSDELEHRIRLLGYSLGKRAYRPGETLRLTLFWQPLQTIQPNLVVFVHILDAQGALVAQHDGVPDEGRRPTPFWQPGVVVSDAHAITLPSEMAPGRYTLSVGMYDWPGLQRLTVVQGPAAGEDHITLETIQVEP